MAIKITEDTNVIYENEPNAERKLFPNLQDSASAEQYARQALEYKNAAETAADEAEASADRAEDVAENIPEDYAQLSADVADLKTDLGNLKLASQSSVGVVSNAIPLTATPTLNRIDLLDAFYTVENNTVKRTIILTVNASFENSDTYTLGTLSGLSPADVSPATNTIVFTAQASDGSDLSSYAFILTNSTSGNLCVVTNAPYTAGYGGVITLTNEQKIVTTDNHIVETAKNEEIYNDLQIHRNIFDASFGRDGYAWNINNNAIGGYNNWSYTQVRVLENISVCLTGLSENASTLGYAVLSSNGTVLQDGGVYDGMVIDIPANAYYLILSYPTADKNNIVIKPYKKHRVVVLGDSWSDNDPTHTTWTKWTTILQNDGRFDVIVYAQNGSTITGDTPNYAQNGNVLGQVNKLIEDKVENVDTVIMFGGINDFRGGATASAVYGKLSEFYNTVNTLYPTARIIYISNNQIFITKEQLVFFHTIHEYLRENIGLECFDTFGWVKPYNYLADNVHVDNEGYKDLYANILSILCGGSVVTVNTEDELTLTADNTLCGAIVINEKWTNGYPVYSAKLVIYSGGLNKNLTREITTSQGLLLCSVPFTKIVNKHLPSAVGMTGAVFMCDCAENFETENKLNTSNTFTIKTPSSNAGTYVTDSFI